MKKLKTYEVAEIKQLLKEGKLKQKEIANQYGVSEAAITSIKKGRTFDYIVLPSEEASYWIKWGYEKCLEDLKSLK